MVVCRPAVRGKLFVSPSAGEEFFQKVKEFCRRDGGVLIYLYSQAGRHEGFFFFFFAKVRGFH